MWSIWRICEKLAEVAKRDLVAGIGVTCANKNLGDNRLSAGRALDCRTEHDVWCVERLMTKRASGLQEAD